MIITLVVIGIILAAAMVVEMVAMTIVNYNIKKHGTWWGNLPNWVQEVVDFLLP